MKSILPRFFGRKTMYAFIRDTLFSIAGEPEAELIFDFSELVFIEPSGITVLANFIQYLGKMKVSVKFLLPTLPEWPSQRNPIKFLDDAGFFNEFL